MDIATKTFEVRDDGTFIPIFCVRGRVPEPEDPNYFLLDRGGWSTPGNTFTYLICLNTNRCEYDWAEWMSKHGSRTLGAAHRYIEAHWDKLEAGAVVDVEFILGITTVPKASERRIV